MATSRAAVPAPYAFDDRKVRWYPLGELRHFVFSMCDVDAKRGIVDFMIKFDPDEQIVFHRHLAPTVTFVVQGEHRIYERDGTLKEIRPCGSYTTGLPAEPHREGGGAEGCVVFYSIRGEQEALFDLMDDDGKITATLGMKEFGEAYEEQKKDRAA